MNYFINVVTPPVTLQAQLANIPDQIVLTGKDDVIDISPVTDNLDGTETYEFVLGHDNLIDMYDMNNPPTADFMFTVDSEGSNLGTPPVANFNFSSVE